MSENFEVEYVAKDNRNQEQRIRITLGREVPYSLCGPLRFSICVGAAEILVKKLEEAIREARVAKQIEATTGGAEAWYGEKI